MFDLFKKKENDKNIYAPIEGKCIDISDVNDKTFAEKVMGDGVAIIPISTIIKAPISGVITMMFPTKHAFGIKREDGLEILVHIGINTVELKGKGFILYKNVNDRVVVGTKIIGFNESYLNDKDMTTMIILTTPIDNYEKTLIGKDVQYKDVIMKNEAH